MKTNVIKILIGAVFLVLFNALFFYLAVLNAQKWIGFAMDSYMCHT